MPSFIDFFNPTFFIFLGMLVLVAALLIVYFESKMRDQNHKITSMFSLVTAITDELNTVKQIAISGGSEKPHHTISVPLSEVLPEMVTLIEVSDDEDTDDDDFSEDDDDDDDSNAVSVSVSLIENKPEIIEIGEFKNPNIKILKVNMSNNDAIWETTLEYDIDFDNSRETDSDTSESSFEEEAEVDKEAPFVLEIQPEVEPDVEVEIVDLEVEVKIEDELDEHDLPKQFIDFDLKSINISNLEESSTETTTFDYKKASINKLREIVLLKGLVEDSTKSSKLKKPELLKLLGVTE